MAVNIDKLKTQLAAAKVRETDFALFQVINQLIDAIRAGNLEVAATIGSGGGTTGFITKTYLTVNNETGTLPNSRRLLAGANIVFDDSISGQRTVSSTGGGGAQWGVLTDGDLIEPEIIFAGGDVVMTHIP